MTDFTPTSDDMFIEIVAPMDAENSKVPFDTKVMYDDKGIEYEVERFVFGTGLHGYGWGVECSLPPENIVFKRPLDSMYLEKPDSLKQLAEDLNRMQRMIESPKDAEGREIPLDTKVLFDKDGQEIEVSRWQYYPRVGSGYWNLKSVRNKYYRQDEVYLTPPDSWEKLEKDLDRCIEGSSSCRYFNDEGVNCSKCARPDSDTCGCTASVFKDIKRRIRKMRGEDR